MDRFKDPSEISEKENENLDEHNKNKLFEVKKLDGWCKVEMNIRVFGEPFFVFLMRAVIVQNYMDLFI